MGGYAENSFFQGNLGNKNLKDFMKMDISKTSLEERKQYLNELIGDQAFFDEYFEKHFKVSINSNEALSTEVNVCKVLENMANYLLNSDESKQMDSDEKNVYVFHKGNERFKKRMNRESFSTTVNGAKMNIVDNPNVVHVLQKKEKNFRLPKKQKITKEDLLRDDKCGEVLRDYQKLLDTINKKIVEKRDKMYFKYSINKNTVQQDMIDAKNMLLGVWGYDTFISESHIPDTEIFDFTDFDTVKYLLQMEKPDFSINFEMWLVWTEFIETIKKANLVEQEAEIVVMLQNQWNIQEIANETGIKYHTLYRTTIPRICKKIMKVGNKYDACDYKVKLKIEKRKEKAKGLELVE